jgi:hypothetical protein
MSRESAASLPMYADRVAPSTSQKAYQYGPCHRGHLPQRTYWRRIVAVRGMRFERAAAAGELLERVLEDRRPTSADRGAFLCKDRGARPVAYIRRPRGQRRRGRPGSRCKTR